MEFDPRTDRLPFNVPDEAEQALADATEPSHDARIRHLQRVPLGSTRASFGGLPSSRGSLRLRPEPWSHRLESPATRSSSSSMARWRCECPSELEASYS